MTTQPITPKKLFASKILCRWAYGTARTQGFDSTTFPTLAVRERLRAMCVPNGPNRAIVRTNWGPSILRAPSDYARTGAASTNGGSGFSDLQFAGEPGSPTTFVTPDFHRAMIRQFNPAERAA